MKNLKLKLLTSVLFLAFIISIYAISGCSKQDKEDTTVNNQKQTDTSVVQDKIQQDDYNQMNHDNTDMNMDSKGKIEHNMIKIPSAQCDICKSNISKAIKNVNGVKSFKVDIDNHIVHVNFDNTLTNLSKIEDAITMAGYDANNKKADKDAYDKLDMCCKKPEDRK